MYIGEMFPNKGKVQCLASGVAKECCCNDDLQNGLATKVEKSRKQMKERKNRAKKIRGVKKVIVLCLFCFRL